MEKKRFLTKTNLLEFDRYNPRLVQIKGLEHASDEDIIQALVREADISELIGSIVANKYMDIEPMIVTQTGTKKDRNYRVLEGNRRLAAIRLLQNPTLARECKISLPNEIPEEVSESLEEVQVYLASEENEARTFIGFKHINGPHRWNSYAKARFLTKWYLEEIEDGITIESIARQLGDENQTVRSLIGGMLVLQQAEEKELFQIQDRTKSGPFGFSHLYTAIGRIEYRDFLGLEKDWNVRPKQHPVEEEKEPGLQEVLRYIYGSKTENSQSVIESQNPNLKELGEVLSKPVALAILRTTHSLQSAYEEVLPASGVFKDRLIVANVKVQETLGNISKFSPGDNEILLPIAETLLDNSKSILVLMKEKIREQAGS